MSKSGDSSGFWMIVVVVIGFAAILQAFSGGGSSSSSTVSSPSPDTFEHRYVRERFKQEGFSNSDAKTAADAVIKFHEAQKNRGR